jgi:hypothetical protein
MYTKRLVLGCRRLPWSQRNLAADFSQVALLVDRLAVFVGLRGFEVYSEVKSDRTNRNDILFI